MRIPTLRSLSLRRCDDLTDTDLASLVQIARRHPALRELDLTGCGQLTDGFLAELRKATPFGKVLPAVR